MLGIVDRKGKTERERQKGEDRKGKTVRRSSQYKCRTNLYILVDIKREDMKEERHDKVL
jgi:hypothetical protein